QGEKTFIPFRQLGQYEDPELDGLYYNRFRYYDASTGLYLSQDPIGLLGNNPTFYGYVHDSNSWVDPFGLTIDAYGGYFSRKALRTEIHNAKRPTKGSSMHATKHIQATSMDDAMERSIKGAGGKPEASYFPDVANNNFNNFEKTAAFDAARNGNVIERGGGNKFLIYEHKAGDIGFNNGVKTRFMRIELTSNTIHSHPISEADARKYLKGCDK
ncbi:RHS repeat-associated core domain-containing protein, partial [Flavobacterium oreochromis]|uniref:RHS repeat-associated core domain-containing protein n=1 Tax=Flavobacterium oreochromis TaxID=2906078 RepID=UPI00385AE4BD